METVKNILTSIWTFINDNSFIIVAIITLLVVLLIIILMVKHIPNKGRITDVYDVNGKKIKGKKKNSLR